MQRNKSFYITMIPIIISVIIGVILLIFHNKIGIQSNASLIVSKERSQYSSDIDSLKAEKDSLNSDIEQYDKVINENNTLISEVESLNSELEGYNSDIQNAQSRNQELQTQLTEKQNYINSLSELAEKTEGAEKKLSDGEYKCPADLNAGRYKAEGSGTILIYDIANNVTDRVNLSTLDSHTYEFDISSGQKIKSEGDVTLTSIELSSTPTPSAG